jgi:hypothetical protein
MKAKSYAQQVRRDATKGEKAMDNLLAELERLAVVYEDFEKEILSGGLDKM